MDARIMRAMGILSVTNRSEVISVKSKNTLNLSSKNNLKGFV